MTVNRSNNRLVIPHKAPDSQTEHATNWALLERWANEHVVNQIVPGTGVTIEAQTQTLAPNGQEPPATGVVTVNALGTYESLTGPGESTTPGVLQQVGGFTISDTPIGPPAGGIGFVVFTAAGVNMGALDFILTASNYLFIDTAGGQLLEDTSGSLGIELRATGVGNFIKLNTSGNIGFFGSGGTTHPTVTGSRGGNAALASLLTALAGLGLIIDGTSA